MLSPHLVLVNLWWASDRTLLLWGIHAGLAGSFSFLAAAGVRSVSFGAARLVSLWARPPTPKAAEIAAIALPRLPVGSLFCNTERCPFLALTTASNKHHLTADTGLYILSKINASEDETMMFEYCTQTPWSHFRNLPSAANGWAQATLTHCIIRGEDNSDVPTLHSVHWVTGSPCSHILHDLQFSSFLPWAHFTGTQNVQLSASLPWGHRPANTMENWCYIIISSHRKLDSGCIDEPCGDRQTLALKRHISQCLERLLTQLHLTTWVKHLNTMRIDSKPEKIIYVQIKLCCLR